MTPRREPYRQGAVDDPAKPRPPSGEVRWEARDKQTGVRLGKFVLAQSWYRARERFYAEYQLECDPILCEAPPDPPKQKSSLKRTTKRR
jgi:hypothetical protein